MQQKPNRLLTDAFREIRKTASRFLSLFLLSALAVAFLAGLRTTAPDMERTADGYYDAHNLMDLHILSTLGLTDEDIAVLAVQEGVSAAEGAYTADALVHLDQNDLIVKLHSLSPLGINAPELLTGRLPEGDDECLVEAALLEKAGLSLGDEISFDTGDGTYEDALGYEDYTVVGTVNSPLYVSVERGSSSLGTGRVSAFALIPAGGFSMDYYTDAYLLADGAAALWCYDDAYQDLIDSLSDALEPLSDQRAGLRYDEVIGEANEKLDEAQQEFDDAEAETNQELADAQQELVDARKKLDDGWAEYEDGKVTLVRETADARRRIADAEQKLPDALRELEDGEADYQDGAAGLSDGKAQYWDGLKDWQDGKKEYDDGYRKLLDGEAEYGENVDKLQSAQQEYDDGWAGYLDGLDQLQDGAAALDDARRQLESAAAELDAGSAALAEGQAQLEEGKRQLEMAQAAYDTALSALTGLLQAIDPSLDENSTDQEIADALTAYLDENLTEENADEYVGELQAWVDGLAGQGVELPDELLEYVDGLTGADLLAAKEQVVANMLDAVAAARAAQTAATGQLDALARQVADGETQLAAGSAALSAGYAQYREGKRQYQEGMSELEASVAQLQDARQQLDDAQAQLDDGWRQLKDGRRELDDGWADLEDAKAQLDDGWAELEDARQEILSGEAELQDARQKLDDGWTEYNDGVAELADAKQTLPRETEKAQRELSDAYAELTDGEEDYADGLQEYEDGRAEADEKLSDARRKLNDARREIADIENCQWYVLGRNTNVGYVSYQQDAERMGNLANVFPLIFFLVAALVCLTTMQRMVEEQRIEIGGKKAMGYGKWAISLKYVGYGFLASALGGIVGLAAGCLLIPWIIFNAWKILYTVGELSIPVYPGISLFSVGAAVFCVTGTAFAACFATLAAVPAELMRPRAPKPGKRVFLEYLKPLWKHMSFTWKVTARNLFRYQRRFWMTVIGIGGCTALLITGFGLRNSIYDILDKQYDEISTYSSQVGLVDDVTNDEMTEIARVLDGSAHVDEWMPGFSESLSVEGPKRSMDAYLFAVEDEARFGDFIHLRGRLDGQAVELPREGAVLTEKLADMLGVEPGDTITLDGDKRVEVPVTALTENYVFHYVYLSSEYYEQLFGEPPATNLIMARYTEDTKEISDEVSASLIPLSGITSVSRIRDSRETFSKSMESVDYAVILITVCAGALAFVVLFNLTNINITERLRELATLKVLGFYNKELSAYVYRENIFLTAFGVLMGLVMGKFLHQWLVLTVEIDMVMFGRSIRPSSYLYSIGLTILFSLLVNLVAGRRLKQIDMVESLKTVD